jgi:hypothetical protein
MWDHQTETLRLSDGSVCSRSPGGQQARAKHARKRGWGQEQGQHRAQQDETMAQIQSTEHSRTVNASWVTGAVGLLLCSDGNSPCPRDGSLATC